jgi:hypothetical protein
MSSAENFLELLEVTINKISKKVCFLVLCGDWNVNLLTDMPNKNALINLLLSNNLVNTVTYPTRVTWSPSSLIGVMITNKIFYPLETKVMEMGYSDHFAVVMNGSINMSSTTTIIVSRRGPEKARGERRMARMRAHREEGNN